MTGSFRDGKVVVADAGEASTLLNRGCFGEPLSGGGVTLTPLEAVYLAEAGRLEVRAEGSALPLTELYRRATHLVPGFEVRYLVYRDLRQRGYIAKEAGPPLDFRVFPRGGGPKQTPAKYGVLAMSEAWVLDLHALEARARQIAGGRKSLLVAVVDEESDVTYYVVRPAMPKGRQAPAVPMAGIPVHLLGDRATVLDPDAAAKLHADGFYGKIVGRRLQLSLLEIAYLLNAGAIDLRRADTNRPVTLAAVLRQARKLQPDFDLRLRVYEDLKGRGVVVKTGFKYGSHFRAYEGDPDRVHAKYLVHAIPAGRREMWPEVSRAVRLAHGVKKDILFASVGDDLRYLRLEWIRP